MACRISELVLGCRDPEALARFWCEVLDFAVLDREDDGSIEIGPREGFGGPQPTIILSRRGEPEPGKPVPGTALHLRPIREADTALDYPAVMGSRERLWGIFGPAWAWPKDTMTFEQDRLDLLRHEQEIAAHQSFNYALLDEQETVILGCVYIDPPERADSDGEVSWWVVDGHVGGEAERALDMLVPQWMAADWPFRQPRYLGRDITWQDWRALPPAS